MNGSNHLEELDTNGLFLCPICTGKLLDTFHWDLTEHCRDLLMSSLNLGFMSAEELEHLGALQNHTEAFQTMVGAPPPDTVDWRGLKAQRKLLIRKTSRGKANLGCTQGGKERRR